MAKVEIKYPSGVTESNDFGEDVRAAIQDVRQIFHGLAEADMAGGFVTLEHNGKGQTFLTDGGISFNYWENNEGGPWGSLDEFLRDTGHEVEKKDD